MDCEIFDLVVRMMEGIVVDEDLWLLRQFNPLVQAGISWHNPTHASTPGEVALTIYGPPTLRGLGAKEWLSGMGTCSSKGNLEESPT
jgi:hypothetical protein